MVTADPRRPGAQDAPFREPHYCAACGKVTTHQRWEWACCDCGRACTEQAALAVSAALDEQPVCGEGHMAVRVPGRGVICTWCVLALAAR